MHNLVLLLLLAVYFPYVNICSFFYPYIPSLGGIIKDEKSTLNGLVHLTPLRITLMNPPFGRVYVPVVNVYFRSWYFKEIELSWLS